MSEPEPNPIVFVVDDDEAVLESLGYLLHSEGFSVQTFPSAELFLEQYKSDQPGCLVLDLRMRGMSGAELHARLTQQGIPLPVIIVTGHGDVPMAVRAIQGGAVDFLEKPVSDVLLLERVRAALEVDRQRRRQQRALAELAARLARLTAREKEVMELILAGYPNKQMASILGIGEKTVEVHRKHVLSKLGVRGAVELVRLLVTRPPHGAPPTPPPTE